MKFKFITLSLLALLFSCSDDDRNTCVNAPTMSVSLSQEFNQHFGYRHVALKGDYAISVPFFITPNGDGVRDTFVINVQNMQTGEIFISDLFSVVESVENATDDPQGFINTASLTISNNCEDLITITDIEKLWWNPVSENAIQRGIYNFNLQLEMADGTMIDAKNSFEVIDSALE